MSINRDTNGRNEVVSKMWEIASLRRYGSDRLIIRHVTIKVIVPNQQYQWNLYERETDPVPVDTVTLNVTLFERLKIDDEVSFDLESDRRRSESRKK